MSTIVVEPAALGALADRLEQVAAELAAAGRELGEGSGVAAPAGLGAAVADFCAAWHAALTRTGDAASAAGEQLRAAAEAYSRADRAVGEALA